MNKFISLCRITKDLELDTSKGTPYARFSIAENNYKGEAQFFNCVAFGKTAETLAQHCGKGSQILIDGEIQLGKYTNKDGVEVPSITVKVIRFDFAGSKNDKDSTVQVKSKRFKNDSVLDISDNTDGLPF